MFEYTKEKETKKIVVNFLVTHKNKNKKEN